MWDKDDTGRPMTDRSSSTTTGHDPGYEQKLSSDFWTGKGQPKPTTHSDHSAKANTALVSKDEKKNIHCPVCGSMVRYLEVRPGSGNLKAECENPTCTWTTDFLRKGKKPLSKEDRLKQWHKFGRRY